jgi:ATP-dependent DNA helicase RecG
LRFGRQPPSYDLSGNESVTVVLPGGPADLALTRFLADEQRRAGRLRVQELLVLGELRRRGSVTPERASWLVQSAEEAARVLDRLRERGLIAVGDDAGEYGLSVDVRRALEAAGAA